MFRKNRIIIAVSVILTFLCLPVANYAGDSGSDSPVPEGVYIKLTKEFYDSLKGKGQGGDNLYSNDPSIEYLKEISISSRFTVETNLHIIKQQEQIIRLLESILINKDR